MRRASSRPRAVTIAQQSLRDDPDTRNLRFNLQAFLADEGFCRRAGVAPGGTAGKTVIVQGFGNVGYHAAKYFSDERGGAKVIGVIEHNGAVYSSKGLDIEALKRHHA